VPKKPEPRISPDARTPQTTVTGSPNPAALAANVMRTLIPMAGPLQPERGSDVDRRHQSKGERK
jgi:hypothetical protein